MVRTGGSGFQPVRSESYQYDSADQLIGVTYATGGVGERMVNYFYDAAGNRTGMVERIGNATNITAYAANSDNQLTSATADRQGITVTGYVEPGPRSNKWYASTATARGQSAAVSGQNGTFAIPGVPVTGGANALTVTVTDVSGNVATQVVNVTIVNEQTAIGYDANGNQTNHNGWTMTYDRENRLISATSATSAAQYSYDALGRLIERRTSGVSATTNRMYYAGWQLIAEYDGAGTLQRKYVYGPGIDEPIRMTVGGTNYYYHADGLGSVTEMTTAAGTLTESYRYDVYGSPTILAPDSRLLTTSLIGNRLLFTGRDHDPDTGWYNYRHRYYNPALGRFVQPDPIGIKGGDVNLYRYVYNSPSRYGDPAGLWTFEGGAGYGYALKIRIGHNSGRWSFGIGLGYGLGLVGGLDSEDRKPGHADKGFATQVGVEVTANIETPSGLGIDLGLGVNTRTDKCNNFVTKTDLTLGVQAGLASLGRTLEIGMKGNYSQGTLGPHNQSTRTFSFGAGGLIFGGVMTEVAW